MTTQQAHHQSDHSATPPTRRTGTTSSWRYAAILAVAGLLIAVAAVQTFGSDVSAATLDDTAEAPPYNARAAAPLPEMADAVPLL